MFIILSLIIIVAAFNIISGLTILVKNKTRDIGILKSIGGSNNSIKKYEKFNNATINKVRLREIIFKDLLFLLKAYF